MASLTTGDTLGPYEIADLIGRGAMGEVYRARDRRLGRTVALKVLGSDLATDNAGRLRFEREAQIVASLNHPHICTLHDVGRQHGRDFLVMEYLEGETLEQRLASGQIPLDESIRIATGIAGALIEAHARGIVHRDIKPGNIMLTSTGPKLLDFGLAKPWLPALWPQHLADTVSDLGLTKEGTVLGTVPYMSPEALEGRELTSASDVFAFGAVLFEMVIGRRAFDGSSGAQIIAGILAERRPSISSVRPELPQALDRLVARCLARNPADRPASMRKVADELEKIGATPVGPTRLKTVYPKWSRRLAVSAAAVFMIGAGVLAGVALRGPNVDSVAVLPLLNETGDTTINFLSDGLSEALINGLSPVRGLRVMSWAAVSRYRDPKVPPDRLASDLDVDSLVIGRLGRQGDILTVSVEIVDANGSQIWGGRYERPRSEASAFLESIPSEIAYRLRLGLTGDDRARLARRYETSDSALELYFLGLERWNRRTPRDLQQSLEFFQKASVADPNFASAYAGQANALALLGTMGYDMVPPAAVIPRAKVAAEAALRIDPLLAEAHAALAFCLRHEYDRTRADAEHRDAVRLDPNYATGHQWLASHLWTIGRFPEALAELNAALAIDPRSSVARLNLARHYYYQRDYEGAAEILRALVGDEPTFFIAREQLAATYAVSGRIAEARAALPASDTPLSIALRGYIEWSGGDRMAADRAINELNRLSTSRYVPAFLFAGLEAAGGRIDRALDALERAQAERSGYLDYIGLDPTLDALRSEPRFISLLKRLNLR